MTSHVLFISSAILLAIQLFTGSASGQELEQKEGPWHRDPFRYEESSPAKVEQRADVTVTSSSPQGLKLKGIILARDGRNRALVNDREVQPGDLIGDARILRISRFEIVVEEEGVTRAIDLFNHHIEWGNQ